MHEVLVNRLGGLSLPGKGVVRLTDHPNMTLAVYRGRKTTMQQQQQIQIRRGIVDYSKIIFLTSHENVCCDLSLESSRRDHSNNG